ncbi:hypothetical protein [Rhodococcus gannanensis]|uniref:Uncharacterized protein n=1 Tax=Rhodococcus gannanensis TaxID=1960308 RepID=A0ABW4P0P4_9NOCA
MRILVAAAVALAGALAIRWIRAGSAVTAQDWARDPIEPDDLAG